MRKTYYTVLLLFPDYLASDFGSDTYMSCVEADSPEEALRKVREKACVENQQDPEQAEDFFCLIIVQGRHADLNPER